MSTETPVDLAAVQADDALLDALSVDSLDLGNCPGCGFSLGYVFGAGVVTDGCSCQPLNPVIGARLTQALRAWRRDVDTEPIPVLIADGYQLPFLVRMRVAIRGFFGLGGE